MFETNCLKHFGVYFDKSLSSKVHIQPTCRKIANRCGFLEKIRSKKNEILSLLYYIVYSKPIVSYGNLVCGSTPKTNLKLILILEKPILRVIFKNKRFESTAEPFKNSQIITVYELHVSELLEYLI